MRQDENLHYLDNAATTLVARPVADAIYKTMTEHWGNPSSLYGPGNESKALLDRARAAVAASIGAKPEEVFFTGCGSESNNIALLGAVEARRHWGNKIVVSGFEHPSVSLPLKRLAEQGFDVVFVNPEQDGHLDLEKFAAQVDRNTILAACMQVNNETGARVNVNALAKLVKARNSRTAFHVDGVQAWMRVPTDLTGIDSFTVSGHKIHAPKGVGALYLHKGHNIIPPYLGGGQEKGTTGNTVVGVRPGTENLPYAVGLATAASLMHKNFKVRKAHLAELNAYLRVGLAQLPEVVINSPEDAVEEVLNISTCCIRSETMLHFLETKKVYVSSGSACAKGAASPTLAAMGLSDRRMDTALRISLCGDNTKEDVDALLAGLKEGLATLARLR